MKKNLSQLLFSFERIEQSVETAESVSGTLCFDNNSTVRLARHPGMGAGL
jgi:hypothetical protein